MPYNEPPEPEFDEPNNGSFIQKLLFIAVVILVGIAYLITKGGVKLPE